MHKHKAIEMGISIDELENMVYEKIEQLWNDIDAEFQQTDEYKAKKEQDELLAAYNEKRAKFERRYGDHTYKYCYDVFGRMRNVEYREKLQEEFFKRQDEEERQRKQQEEYYRKSAEYGQRNNRSYSNNVSSNYTEEETALLKKFLRTLSKEYHPDTKNGSEEAMKFVNKLKEKLLK